VTTQTGDDRRVTFSRAVSSSVVMGTTKRFEAGRLELVQSRIVSDDVSGLACFYAALVGTDVVVNDYYVEVPTRAQRIGLSRNRFSDVGHGACRLPGLALGEVILDFASDDVDVEYARIDALGVEWLAPPTRQPWGRRSMMLRDPEGHLVNVFEKKEDDT
jgi:predicted enzyme related to lactoylglutathione lyase